MERFREEYLILDRVEFETESLEVLDVEALIKLINDKIKNVAFKIAAERPHVVEIRGTELCSIIENHLTEKIGNHRTNHHTIFGVPLIYINRVLRTNQIRIIKKESAIYTNEYFDLLKPDRQVLTEKIKLNTQREEGYNMF